MGYTSTYSKVDGGSEPDDDDGSVTETEIRVVTNKHNVYTTQIMLTKNWDDDFNREGVRPSPEAFLVGTAATSGKLHLYMQSGQNSRVELTLGQKKTGSSYAGRYVYPLMNGETPLLRNAEVEIKGRDGTGEGQPTASYTIIYRNLPRYDYDNGLITYTIDEGKISGYTKMDSENGSKVPVSPASNAGVTTQNARQTASVTNKHTLHETTVEAMKSPRALLYGLPCRPCSRSTKTFTNCSSAN